MYPPGKANPVVNVGVVLNPFVCVAGINVGRCRIFIGKSKFDRNKTRFSNFLIHHFFLNSLNDVVKIGFVFGCVRAVAILT